MNDTWFLLLSKINLIFNNLIAYLSRLQSGKTDVLIKSTGFYAEGEIFFVLILLFFSVWITRKLLIDIPVKYFEVEAIRVGYSILLLIYFMFGCVFIYSINSFIIIFSLFTFLNIALLLIIIDYKTGYLPDILTYLLLWLGLLYQVWAPAGNVIAGVYGVVLSYLIVVLLVTITEVIKNQPQMGRGDFKLIAACAAWLGVWQLPYFLGLAAGLGLIHFVVAYWFLPKFKSRFSTVKRRRKIQYVKEETAMSGHAIPFGPAILISASVWLYISVIQNLNVI
ncbi:prepilin peptidase [Providencia sp. Me31A]|uniref:prepilin peptidase n=1 Tax=Providencia sp. Me31A TaxID=3392637 RepID=UPI003D2CE4CE